MALLLVTPVFLLTAFKKESENTQTFKAKSVAAISHVGLFSEGVKINISDAIVVQGDKGQKNVEVMVLLSKASPEPVSVEFSTKDRTAKQGVDYVSASGSVKFEPGEVSNRISVAIIGQVAADPDADAATQGDIEFWVNLNNAIGGIIENSTAIITILKNLRDPRFDPTESIYEVCFIYTGYLSLYGTAEDCGVNPNGTVVLCGLLRGRENVDRYDDISYDGTMQMTIGIDICSSTRLANGEDKLCGLRVSGSGTVKADLVIYFGSDTLGRYDGRGGYIKIENEDGRFMRTVTGECDGQQIDEEWTMIPNKSIASVFNGCELPMLVTRTLRPGVYPGVPDDHGNKTTVNVVRKIR